MASPSTEWTRHRCCDKSSCFYCPICWSPLPPDGYEVPRVQLPLRVAIALREEPQKSTGVHAKVLAPASVDVYDAKTPLPAFDPATTVVAFPSADARTLSELPDLASVETVVMLCCPWQQPHKLLELPELAPLRRVRLSEQPGESRFWRVAARDGADQLSTIEALAALLEEYGRAARTADGAARQPAPARHPLLFFFDLIRAKITAEAASRNTSASMPWSAARREKRRRDVEQPARVRERSVGRTRRLYGGGGSGGAAGGGVSASGSAATLDPD